MSLNYTIVAQGAEDYINFHRSPSGYLWPCLRIGAWTDLLGQMSIYTGRRKNGGQDRLLYLNMVAMGMWTAMLRAGTVIGQVHRPPQSARLLLGMPFRGRSWTSLRWASQEPVVAN